jgi:uncharacterized membrane protein
MQKLLAATALVLSVSVVSADEFSAVIKKVDGNKVTLVKGKRGQKAGEEIVMTAAENVKVLKGKYDRATKKFEAGDPLEGGLKNKIFEGGKTRVRVITEGDSNTITEIRVTERKRGGGKKKKKDDTQ